MDSATWSNSLGRSRRARQKVIRRSSRSFVTSIFDSCFDSSAGCDPAFGSMCPCATASALRDAPRSGVSVRGRDVGAPPHIA